jgi:hypothetical protein
MPKVAHVSTTPALKPFLGPPASASIWFAHSSDGLLRQEATADSFIEGGVQASNEGWRLLDSKANAVFRWPESSPLVAVVNPNIEKLVALVLPQSNDDRVLRVLLYDGDRLIISDQLPALSGGDLRLVRRAAARCRHVAEGLRDSLLA